MATTSAPSPSPKMFCGECGGSYPLEDLARFGNNFVCINCKPAYLQRMREGVQPLGTTLGTTLAGAQYGGFWIRALALLIDGLIVGVVSVPILLLVGLSAGGLRTFDPQNPPLAQIGLGYLLLLAVIFAYHVWFVSAKGGTPGKLALGLRVVTAGGKNLTIPHSIGRYFAHILSAITLNIGYIIAAFDSEKRALHDHVCGTRVIRR